MKRAAGLLVVTALAVAAPLAAQCPDGSPPPCARPAARAAAVAIDANRIAVLPFRVTGADTALAEGLAELVALEFPGGGGPRAADVGNVIRAWRRAGGTVRAPLGSDGSSRVATQVGAGQALVGSVVGLGGRITLSATIVAVPDGRERARARVDGPMDSLALLVPRLALGLLAGQAGPGGVQATVGTQSPDALRAYLSGAQAFRDGRYVEAVRDLQVALDHDSAFALAARRLQSANGWLGGIPGTLTGAEQARAARLVRQNLDRLPAGVRLLYAAATDSIGHPAERGALLERAAVQLGDDPHAWYQLGDWFFHTGPGVGISDWEARAEAAFRRALDFDPTFSGPLSHLASIELGAGRLPEARRLGAIFLRTDSTASGGVDAIINRWGLAYTFSDPEQIREVWRRIEANPALAQWGVLSGTVFGVGIEGFDRLADMRERAATTGVQRVNARTMRAGIALQRGRPRAALAALDSAVAAGMARVWRDVNVVAQALDWNGDRVAAADALPRVEVFAAADTTQLGAIAECLLGRWALAAGAVEAAATRAARLRDPERLRARGRSADLCVHLIEAGLAVAARRADARVLVARADSVATYGSASWPLPYANLAISRLAAGLGDSAAALVAVRRHVHPLTTDLYSEYLLATARYSAAARDTAGAVISYRRFLALRNDPEPPLVPQRDSARAELARLEGRR